MGQAVGGKKKRMYEPSLSSCLLSCFQRLFFLWQITRSTFSLFSFVSPFTDSCTITVSHFDPDRASRVSSKFTFRGPDSFHCKDIGKSLSENMGFKPQMSRLTCWCSTNPSIGTNFSFNYINLSLQKDVSGKNHYLKTYIE